MGIRFNPPPNWPPPPPGFVPPPRWQPDPSWPPPPAGWQLWVEEDPAVTGPRWSGGPATGPISGPITGPGPSGPATGPVSIPPWPPDFPAVPRDFGDGDASFPGDFRAGAGGVPTGPHDVARGPGDFPAGTATAPPFDDPTQSYSGGRLDRRGSRPGASRTNVLAIASFVLGLLGITVLGILLSVIFGVVALRQIRRTGQRGKGLAIAGFVLSGCWVLILAGFFLFHHSPKPASPASAGKASSSPSASPASSASPANSATGAPLTSIFSLATGQCFQNPTSGQAVLGITDVAVVSCTTPHNAEVFAQFTVSGTSYPGTAALQRQADKGCHARISGNVLKSKVTSAMTLRYLYPLQSSWTAVHRTVSCLVVSPKPNMKSSVLRAHPAH